MNGVLAAASAILWALSSVLWLASAMQKAPYENPAPNSEGDFSLGDGGILQQDWWRAYAHDSQGAAWRSRVGVAAG
jgi:hypothetical protein